MCECAALHTHELHYSYELCTSTISLKLTSCTTSASCALARSAVSFLVSLVVCGLFFGLFFVLGQWCALSVAGSAFGLVFWG